MKILWLIIVLFIYASQIFAQTYDELVDLSFKFIEQNNLIAAEVSLENALKSEPANQRNVLLLSNLGTIQRRQGKVEDALVSYTGALGRAPRNVTLLANRASLYSEIGQIENAITDYTALLLIDNTDESTLYQRGLLYLQIKNFPAAQKDFERIVELNSNTLEGRMGIATLCKLRKEYDEAEKIYYFLIEKAPDNASLYASRSELYLLMDKRSRAMNDINKAIELQKSPDPYTYVLRARIKLLQYEKKAALADIEKAVLLGYNTEDAQSLISLCK